MSKDNIMKHTDGLFHQVFDEVAKEYTDIEAEHYIIDIGSAMLAARPDRFDVIVTLNLYGDIISDITAQVAGSVGLGGSSNIGNDISMFEAIHGSAPDISGKGLANPSGLIHAACMMLAHIGQPKIAEKILNALLVTLEDGLHTADLYNETYTTQRVSTQQFGAAVIERLGRTPQHLTKASFGDRTQPLKIEVTPTPSTTKKLVGVDVFIDWTGTDRNPEVLGKMLEEAAGNDLKLKMITNRGVKVYPNGFPETFCTDHWRCRFVAKGSKVTASGSDMNNSLAVSYGALLQLQQRLVDRGLNFIKTENLYEINGKRAYSLGQGE